MKAAKFDEILTHFDLALVDIWGILSDGFTLFEPAIPFLEYLKKHKLFTILLSNTPVLNNVMRTRLKRMGLPSKYTKQIVTSGDVTRYLFGDQKAPWEGRNYYYYIGPAETQNILKGLKYSHVSDIAKADFLVVTGYPDELSAMRSIKGALQKALIKKLPMLCPDPDQAVTLTNKMMMFCAGKIGRQYELLGGQVLYIGKPFPPIYDFALREHPGINASRIVVIGDNLDTDIAGAQRMGFKSVLISSKKLAVNKFNIIQPDWQFKSLEAIYRP